MGHEEVSAKTFDSYLIRLRFVLPISRNMTMPMGSFDTMLLFVFMGFMAQFCMA